MSQQRILITGASGFVGGHLCKHFAGADTVVGACSYTQQVPLEIRDLVQETHTLDLSDRSEVNRLIQSFRPDVLVNCAALSKGALCERDPEAARRSNVDAIKHLISANKPKGGFRLIHLSTDLVFDALRAPQGGFLEDSIPQAISTYGQSKLAAEELVLGAMKAAAVCRLSLVYGTQINRRGGFMDWVMSGLKNQEEIDLFVDEWRTPVFVEDVCCAIEAAAARELTGPKVFHLSGSERIDRYRFGLKAAEVFGYSSDCIREAKLADSVCLAPRASDVSLNNESTSQELGISFLDVESGLKRMKALGDASES